VPFQRKYAFGSSVDSLLGSEYQLHSRTLEAACKEEAIPYLDLTPLPRRAETTGQHLYWNFDEHLRGSGYPRVGATIEAWMDSPSPINELISLN
jgi:hypothetical protein